MIRNSWNKLILFGFRLLYNELAWMYDAVSWLVSLGDWQAWQLTALPFVKGKEVLEIGHGPGHLLVALHKSGFQVTGLDLSPYMENQAQRQFLKVSASVPLVRGDVADLPLAEAVFDTVVAAFPTNYITNPAVLAEVNRVLRANGRFLIIPGATFSGSNWLYRFIEWLYTITGQREGGLAVNEGQLGSVTSVWHPIQERFADAGFRTEFERIHLSRSVVTLLIAHKEIGSTDLPLVQSQVED